MKDFPQKHYICQSGEVRKQANEHRKIFTRLRGVLFDVVHSVGATSCRIQDSMMLLRSIQFDGEPPVGWTKKDKHGCSRPRNLTSNKEILRHFTPCGHYTVKKHPELSAFDEWLKVPLHFKWTKGKDNYGWRTIGRMFADGLLYWYSAGGPILAILPDVAYARTRSKELGETVDNNVLCWKPPKGLKEIMPEEWDLMSAKHKKLSEKRAPLKRGS